MRNRSTKLRLYEASGKPCSNFNKRILEWLDGSVAIREHKKPASFEAVRAAYELGHQALLQTEGDDYKPRWAAHKLMLSGLTELMFGVDIRTELATRLTSTNINVGGFRSALAQGFAKNTGENFINTITYALADALSNQDEVLVDKGLPSHLRKALTLKRTFTGTQGETRELTIPIEGDLTIFSRHDPDKAIIINAKTRLKEVFHIGTMWAMFFDLLDDPHSLQKWNLKREVAASTKNMLYVFATADMISEKGENTQGSDIRPEGVRNLIAVDASFFDYVFVSKQEIPYVSGSLNLQQGRETLFHELGCLLDLIEQMFADVDFSSTSISTSQPTMWSNSIG